MELHERIRRLYYLKQKSGWHIARKLGVSRHAVAKALQTVDVPTYRLSKLRATPR